MDELTAAVSSLRSGPALAARPWRRSLMLLCATSWRQQWQPWLLRPLAPLIEASICLQGKSEYVMPCS